MPDLSPTIIKGGEDLALSTKYEFREDNSCTEISSFYPEGIRGTWVLNTDSMILAIRNTDKEIAGNSDYHISFESETHMTWKQNFDGLGSIEMTLTKAKR
jgi:hypothetical protein